MSEKLQNPPPERLITREDFIELIDQVNNTIEQSDLSDDRLNNIEFKINDFNKTIDNAIGKFYTKQEESENQINNTLDRVEKLNNRIESFYAKIIEIVGIFIAVFAIIIAGIQISFKAEGSFAEVLLKSAAIFLPIVMSLGILILLIKWIIKR